MHPVGSDVCHGDGGSDMVELVSSREVENAPKIPTHGGNKIKTKQKYTLHAVTLFE